METSKPTAATLGAISDLVFEAADLLDQLGPVSKADAGALLDLYADVHFRLEAELHKALVRLADGGDIDGKETRTRFHDGRLYHWPEPKPILAR
jgi:hypothetical protein